MKRLLNISILFFLIIPLTAQTIKIKQEEALSIGNKIWQNECKGTIIGLTSWNEGEEFASLGIGHFIWFPQRYRGGFTERFPQLIHFLIEKKVSVPKWIRHARHCPWPTRESFLNDFNSPTMNELRQLLSSTVDFQIQFIVQRLHEALPTMIAGLTKEKQGHVQQQFFRIAKSPNGIYALIDYCHFKGEGIKDQESYNSHRWGLLQVLQEMKGKKVGKEAINEFQEAAYAVLERRVKHSPPERNEQRWLPGWKKRLETYIS